MSFELQLDVPAARTVPFHKPLTSAETDLKKLETVFLTKWWTCERRGVDENGCMALPRFSNLPKFFMNAEIGEVKLEVKMELSPSYRSISAPVYPTHWALERETDSWAAKMIWNDRRMVFGRLRLSHGKAGDSDSEKISGGWERMGNGFPPDLEVCISVKCRGPDGNDLFENVTYKL